MVVGASMVGIKIVELLNGAGIHTTLVDMAPYLFPLAAYRDVGEAIAHRVAQRGVDLVFRAGLESLRPCGEHEIEIRLSGGIVRRADMLVICIGTRPSISFLDREQIRVGRGIIVDRHMRTSALDLYAAGDCCEGMNLQSGEPQIIGLWANAARQGIVAGVNMAGGQAVYEGNILHNITHFMDMDFIGLGDNRVSGREITFGEPERGLFIKAVLKDGALAGVNILNNYRISGILKNYFIRMLEGRTREIAPLQWGILRNEGLTKKFVEELEGELA